MTIILPEAYCEKCQRGMMFISKDRLLDLKKGEEKRIVYYYKCIKCMRVRKIITDGTYSIKSIKDSK